jgi:hypothetical protein
MKNVKLQALLHEDRPFKARLLTAALIAAACSFTFVVFGMIDLFITNNAILPFSFRDLVGPTLLVGALCFLIITGILLALRGRLFDIMVSLAMGLLMAGYIQGNFLNLPLGQLTGDSITWERYSIHAVVNLLVWAIIVISPLIIGYFSKPLWKRLVIFLPVLLIGMQLAGLLNSMMTSDALRADKRERYLSVDGIYELSSKENVIVIVLDRLDGKYIDEIFADDPDFFAPLDGFTHYPNHTSLYCRTFPSATYMLTGQLSFYDTPAREYFEKAWGESTFLPDLRQNNYATKLYMQENYTYSDIAQLDGLIDNIDYGELHADSRSILKHMLHLSAYRYAPHALKASFWLSSDAFNDVVKVERGIQPYLTNDHAFYQGLVNTRLSLQDRTNNFAYYHLNGSHSPHTLNERVELVSAGQTSITQQTKGCFEITYEFIRQMKALGIYDDATIIITGDHGKSEDVHNLSMYKTTGLFVKPSRSVGTPLAHSDAPVSHENFRATIIKSAGLDSGAYGEAYFDVPEDAEIKRKFYYRINAKDNQPGVLEVFEIIGDARDFNNWHKIDEVVILYPHG